MHIIPFKGLDEGLGHAIGFGAVIGGRTNQQSHHPGKLLRLVGHISRAVVAEPLDSHRQPIHSTKTGLNGLCHQVPDHVSADASGCGDVTHDLPVTAIHAEGHADSLPIPAGNLEGVGAPAQIAPDHLDSALVSPDRPARMPLQKQVVLLHDPIDPLVVHRNVPKLPVEKGRYPAVTVSGAIVHDLADQSKIALVLGLLVKPLATLWATTLLILMRSRDAHRPGNPLHGVSSFPNKGAREISFFSRAIRTASITLPKNWTGQ